MSASGHGHDLRKPITAQKFLTQGCDRSRGQLAEPAEQRPEPGFRHGSPPSIRGGNRYQG